MHILSYTTNLKKTNVLLSPPCQYKHANANKLGRGSQIFGKVKKIINLFMGNVPILNPKKTPENTWFSEA